MLSIYKNLSDKIKYYKYFNRASHYKSIPESYVRKYLIPCDYPKTRKKQHMHPVSMFQFKNFVKETDWEVTEEDEILRDSIIPACIGNRRMTFQFNLDYACDYNEGEKDGYADEDDDFSW